MATNAVGQGDIKQSVEMRQQLLRNVQAVTAVFGHMEVKMHNALDTICDRMIITQRRLLQDAQPRQSPLYIWQYQLT